MCRNWVEDSERLMLQDRRWSARSALVPRDLPPPRARGCTAAAFCMGQKASSWFVGVFKIFFTVTWTKRLNECLIWAVCLLNPRRDVHSSALPQKMGRGSTHCKPHQCSKSPWGLRGLWCPRQRLLYLLSGAIHVQNEQGNTCRTEAKGLWGL